MLLIMLLQMVSTMVLYLSNNLKPCHLYDLKDFGRISYHRPAPPPQIFFPTSADYADDYFLRSLSNLSATMNPSVHANGTDTFGNLPKADAPFSGVFHLPRLASAIFRGVEHAASWIASTVVDIIVAALMALPAVGPPGAVAWTLLEQWKRDQDNLEATGFALLLNFLLDSRLDKYLGLLRSQKATFKRRLDKIIGEHDSAVQALRAREKDLEAANDELRVLVTEKDDEIERRKEELAEKGADALTRIAELERRLAAQEKAAEEAKEEAAKDRAAAQENIKGLQTSMSSNTTELAWRRQKMGAQAQQAAAMSAYQPTYPAPFPPPPAPMVGQFPQGQGPYAPRPTQTPGFPPDRTSGFMGSTPPPGRGGGAGRGGGWGGGNGGGRK